MLLFLLSLRLDFVFFVFPLEILLSIKDVFSKKKKRCGSCFSPTKNTCLTCGNFFCIRCSVFEEDENTPGINRRHDRRRGTRAMAFFCDSKSITREQTCRSRLLLASR